MDAEALNAQYESLTEDERRRVKGEVIGILRRGSAVQAAVRDGGSVLVDAPRCLTPR